MATLTVIDTGEFSNNLQPFIGNRHIAMLGPGTGATTTGISKHGTDLATIVGTIANPALAATTIAGQARRFTNVSAGTAPSYAEIRGAQAECWRGNGAGFGGFMFRCRFALEGTLQTGMRAFVGLADIITAQANYDPLTSTAPGKMGLAINASTGNWNFVSNITGSAPTVTALDANFIVALGALLELSMYCAPNGSTVFYKVLNVGTGAAVFGTVTTNLPSSATFLDYYIWATNNGTAAAVTYGVTSLYLESNT